MAIGVSTSQVLIRKSDGEAIEKAQADEMEACYGGEVVESVEEGRWEVVAEVCGVVDYVAGDLLRKSFRKVGWQEGLGGVRANLLRGDSLQLKPHGIC